MTVYVDDFRVPARVGRLSARWSHLTVGPDDNLDELHEFATRIGLQRRWFQNKGWPRDHYDVTDTKRDAAIAAGAVPIGWREAGEMRAEAVQARRVLCDLLSLVGVFCDAETVGDWTQQQRWEATKWAAAEHLGASDNPVKRLPRPSFLPAVMLDT